MAYRETDNTRAKKANNQARLFSAAQELLLSDGFNGVQIQRIAEQAGMATGSVYRYFSSRAELCVELFRYYSQHEVDHLRSQFCAEGTCQQRLTTGIQGFITRALVRPTLSYALIAEPVDPLLEAERLHFRAHYASLFADLIEQGVAQGEFPPQVALISANALVGTIAECLVKPAHLGASEQSLDTLIQGISQFCLRAVTGTVQ